MSSARQRILTAAAGIHRARGLSALTIRAVARKVGVTPMAIYRHFRDKEALVEALVDSGFVRWESSLATAIDVREPVARIRAALIAYAEFALRDPHSFELMFLSRRENVPEAPRSLAGSASPAFSTLITTVREAMGQSMIAEGGAAETTLLAWATAHGLIALHFSGRFGHDARKFQAVYVSAVDRLLGLLAASAPIPSRSSRTDGAR